METICSADFPLTPSGCVVTPCLSSGPVCLFLVSTCHMGGRCIMSSLTPLLGPGLPEDRNPGPTTLHDSLRPGGAPCSPARRLEAVAPPPGLRAVRVSPQALSALWGSSFHSKKLPRPFVARQALGGTGVRGCGSGLCRSNSLACALSCSTACGIFLGQTCVSCVGRQILYH